MTILVQKYSNVTKTKPQWFRGCIYKENQNVYIKFFFSKVINVIYRFVTTIILVTPL